MSEPSIDLNKFQKSEAWLSRLKTFFLRSPQYNELEESFDEKQKKSTGNKAIKNCLEDNKKVNSKQSKVEIDDNAKMEQENKENIDSLKSSLMKFNKNHTFNFPIMQEKSVKFNQVFNTSQSTHHTDTNEMTFIDEPSLWRQTTEESFELHERIFDRTLTNSNKTDSNVIFKSHNLTSKFANLADQTQLNDIEAPSTLWENSVINDNLSTVNFQTSPIKMVGMSRPSTIFEESKDYTDVSNESVSSDSISYKTVPKMSETSMTNDHFQTANDESIKTDNNTIKWEILNNKSLSNADEITYNDGSFKQQQDESKSKSLLDESFSLPLSYSNKKHKFYNNDKFHQISSGSATSTTASTKSTDSLESKNTLNDVSSILEDSLNLSEFNFMNKRNQISNDSLLSSEKDPSEINLISLDDTLFEEQLNNQDDVANVSNLIDFDKSINVKPNLNDATMATVSDEEEIYAEQQSSGEENSLNKGFSIQENDFDGSDITSENIANTTKDSEGCSREFNDTIEEMEYIMQKGMKLMSTGTTPKTIKPINSYLSPFVAKKSLELERTPSPRTRNYGSPKTPNTVISKPSKTLNKKTTPLTNKVTPQESKFKMPSSSAPVTSRIPQIKHTGIPTLKKQNYQGFQNIISPIGAYINNTPVAPIISSAGTSKTTFKDSKCARNLENASKAFNTPTAGNTQSKFGTTTSCSLPKKAYIASEYKHYVDKRAPIKIPGGEKIHKYLEPAKLPTVIKHDGKAKLNNLQMKSKDNYGLLSTTRRTVDSSIADLSVMSGDVSLLTIKDSQKLGTHHK